MAVTIFVAVYALIVSERIHRTLAALLGASAVILTGLLDQREAYATIDLNVIFLLIGTMSIANVLGRTGVFQWLAVEGVRRAQGRPYRLLVATSVLAALASMLLNSVTAVVLLTPITFFVADRLRLSPVPFLVSMIITSNVGATATLIGGPPNLIIGGAFALGFDAFVGHALPAAAVVLAVYLVQARWLFRRDLRQAAQGLEADDIARLVQDERRIADPTLLKQSGAVIVLTIIGFFASHTLGIGEATVALTGAVVLMIIAKEDVREVRRDIEWTTLLFFVGLFIVIGGVVKTGVIGLAAQQVLTLTQGDGAKTAFVVLFASAVISALVDNIPYAATMAPLVAELGRSMRLEPLIWALVLGAGAQREPRRQRDHHRRLAAHHRREHERRSRPPDLLSVLPRLRCARDTRERAFLYALPMASLPLGLIG